MELTRILLLVPLFIGLQLFSPTKGAGQYFIRQPVDQTVAENEDVILDCAVGNKTGSVAWLRGGLILVLENGKYGPGFDQDFLKRVELNQSEEGQFGLELQDVQKTDEDEYTCLVYGQPSIWSPPARLRVVVPPICSLIPSEGGGVGLAEGDTVTLACTSQDMQSSSTLVWSNGSQPLGAQTSPIAFHPLRLTEYEHRANFTCTEYNPLPLPPLNFSCSLGPLNVSSPPAATPSPGPSPGHTEPAQTTSAPPGIQIVFKCVVDAKLNGSVVYAWILNGSEVAGQRNDTLVVSSASVECRVRDLLGADIAEGRVIIVETTWSEEAEYEYNVGLLLCSIAGTILVVLFIFFIVKICRFQISNRRGYYDVDRPNVKSPLNKE